MYVLVANTSKLWDVTIRGNNKRYTLRTYTPNTDFSFIYDGGLSNFHPLFFSERKDLLLGAAEELAKLYPTYTWNVYSLVATTIADLSKTTVKQVEVTPQGLIP